ncbi:hypothetical protein [Falsibacillus albus]|uniref:hypothetical protein n=1 Tax=Falsibacillus albus TaxID=2478915 RepID=UPI00131403D3|nr:hypothetical protein [Falsibacillus albus]
MVHSSLHELALITKALEQANVILRAESDGDIDLLAEAQTNLMNAYSYTLKKERRY